LTPRERMLAAARGIMPDIIPYAPRIDLWFHSNQLRGTLPDRYRKATSADDIAIAEGWALHKVVLEFMAFGEDAIIDRCLGVYRIPTQGFLTQLPADVQRRVEKHGDEFRVEYHTPIGQVKGSFVFSDEMRRSGISVPWIKDHLLKKPEDYETVGYLFEHMRVEPAYDGYNRWAAGIGDNGLPVAYALTAGSPMHHIMKILLDSTDFYYKYRDYKKEMFMLAEKMGGYFEQVIEVISNGPAEVALIGANFDDMLTYPPFFKEHIYPWLQRASDRLHRKNKLMLCHTDGENRGLIELLYTCGMDIADSVCPYPMTKLRISEYYKSWGDKITIFGGIPSNLMLEESATDPEFESYLDTLFSAIYPGSRFILGIADTTPPFASFRRLQRIHELVQQRGRLPLKKSESFESAAIEVAGERPQADSSERATHLVEAGQAALPFCQEIQAGVLSGDQIKTPELVKKALASNVDADTILHECLLPPMDLIGEKFTNGTVFIPEVLLSARALNEAMSLLEPVLAGKGSKRRDTPLVVLGTVKGDMHDIGKNLVGIMLRSVGFKVKDLGINVPAERFVQEVAQEKPQILALSALLTTTMPEFTKVIDALKKAGLRHQVKVMVGGAPVSEGFARSVGADAYGPDAGQAALKAKQLLTL
jgi:corrinoid protein of di/trimethylamine methyltransferase